MTGSLKLHLASDRKHCLYLLCAEVCVGWGGDWSHWCGAMEVRWIKIRLEHMAKLLESVAEPRDVSGLSHFDGLMIVFCARLTEQFNTDQAPKINGVSIQTHATTHNMAQPARSESPALSAGSPEPEMHKQSGVKRQSPSSDAEDAPPVSKRAAKRRKKAAERGDYDEIDEERQINPAIALMDGSLLADHVARQIKRFDKDLSAVELEDKRLPGQSSQSAANFLQMLHLPAAPMC